MLCIRHRTGIKPAVDYFRYTVHHFAALWTFDFKLINIRSVQLNCQGTLFSRKFLQFLSAANRKLMSAVITFPDIKRSSPITVTGNPPILYILKPVPKSAFSDCFRNPVDLFIIIDQILFYRRHFDEPGRTCIIDQRRSTSPAVRIIMLEFRCCK